ncbi:ATP-dependent dethiobiotin synthetase BioD 1 [Ensifer psoraleae]|uniref:dethiobiotin synthase n=1 Tax=Sinorhizobium psoraleae TaxID=520838 RepID=UPI0015681059|nr:dethiobiotin synthase [Sinorhizobium psoraleae]NRP70006.1 ATP-dependent dethiobiotin synthetase BioD 1 [Sinorhizobium psoraleae]
MTLRLVITGTDTGVGKTVFAAALTDALSGSYWKPVQSGLEDATDSETVRRLGQIAPDRILSEAYRLTTPASPHLSAKLDGVTILRHDLSLPDTDAPLVIEGAGGLMVPLTDRTLFADVFARWRIPVVLCARTGLGTINHTLLSLEALRARSIPIVGVAFIGDEQPDTQATIASLGPARVLGRLPRLEPLTPDALRQAFRANFDIDAFREAPV